jgi:hypothetical protein
LHKRLGELYEAKGQRDKALQHYRSFLALWKDADPELQPKVTDASSGWRLDEGARSLSQ